MPDGEQRRMIASKLSKYLIPISGSIAVISIKQLHAEMGEKQIDNYVQFLASKLWK